MDQAGLDQDRLQLVWVSAAEGQRFQEKVEEMKKRLAVVDLEEIKRGMKFFGDREKGREGRLLKEKGGRAEKEVRA
jgi:hypothetical protein